MPFKKLIKGGPDWHEDLNENFGSAVDRETLAAHNADPNAHGGTDGAPKEHRHEIPDVNGLPERLGEHDARLDELQDLMSGDMPGAVIFKANFAALTGIMIRDGVWNKDRRTIEA